MNWTSDNIRDTFLKYFEKKQHELVPSAPIVIKDDPTLMFTNAGMNQFKGIFLGNETRDSVRVADTQKCLRVSGKHNDLEEVGRDHYHHTMFEMLGNWSFGDYFKKEAIEWAWELLTKVYGLDAERMYVTIFSGDEDMKLSIDQEAKDFWSNHVSEDRILPFDRKDNFWEMGETGPCGPCSEIHFDMRSDEERNKENGASLVNKDHPEVIEIWNLVFIQFNRSEKGELSNLKAKHIDTGMGLERLTRVLQGAKSNYDIDSFQALIKKTESLTNKKYKGSEDLSDVAFRVIADHVRAVSFCVADGQLPSNTGAGYVIRRVLRRAIRYGFSQLEMSQPFIYELGQTLIDSMSNVFPELGTNRELIIRVIQEEEKSFLTTLEKGLDRLSQYLGKGQDTIKGEFAFELYDTYGFPIDLTQLIADEKNVKVDMDGFKAELKKQKERSRSASKAEFGDWNVLVEGKNSEFLGYEQLEHTSRVMKYRKAKVKGKEVFQLVLEQTPFYAESGGQVGDKGVIEFLGTAVNVYDVKKENNEIIHFVDALPDDLTGDVRAEVDGPLRQETMKHHTATHLLHYALRDILGKHVEQRGSLVEPGRLRFDFSHFEKISEAQIEEIEWEVRQSVAQQVDLEEWLSIPISKAKEMGAMALFGEKYGDHVRVIKFGDSVELCGGTHVFNTAQVGGFKIISEGSVASGIRRVEALSGLAYQRYVNKKLSEVAEIDAKLGNPKNAVEAVQKLVDDNKALQKQIEGFKKAQQEQLRRQILDSKTISNGFESSVLELNEVEGKLAKDAAHAATSSISNLMVVIAGSSEDKPYIIVAISKGLVESKALDAGKMVRELAKHINGGGGGQKFLAMAGGKNKKGLKEALVQANIMMES